MTTDRHLLVVAHTGRAESLAAAVQAVHYIRDAGLIRRRARGSVDELCAAAEVEKFATCSGATLPSATSNS